MTRLFLCSLLSIMAATPLLAQTTRSFSGRTLAVSGNGAVSLTPDIAYISLGVTTENPAASPALTSNNASTQALLATLKGFGIADADITTTNFSVYPRTEWNNRGERVGLTYVVSNNLRVTVRDMSRLGTLLDSVTNGEATYVGGLSFDVSNRESAQEDALADAMRNARSRAEALALAAGVTVGEVLLIDTTYGQVSLPSYPNLRAEADSADAVPVSAGSTDVTARVGVVFAIQ